MSSPAPATPTLSWPPPALEPIHGKLWPAIAVLVLADILLVLPLLVSLGTEQPLGSLGPFGDAYWVPLATTFFGSIALLGGLWHLARLCWGARTAARAGHGWRTILAVTADEPRDTGFLLTGARAYASLPPSARDTLIAARVWAASLNLAAVLLMPAGLSLAIVLGRLGATQESFLWAATFWLPLVLGVGGLFAGAAARLLARSARRSGPRSAAPDAAVESAVSQWNTTLTALRGGTALAGKPARPQTLSAGAVGVLLLALFVVVPVGLITLGGTIGSIIGSIASPNFSRTKVRLAAVEVLRRFALEPDASISQESAGEALHALLSAGGKEADRKEPEIKPARSYAEPWWPEDPAGARFDDRPGWVDSLFARRARSAAETGYLRRVAAHPAHAEFVTVARARAADVLGARYQLPFGPSVTWVNLPIPRYRNVRNGARAHTAKAALELADGRTAQAEQTIREVISVGFRLIDDGPTLIDNMIGTVLVGIGGDALEQLYRATGRSREAETLSWVRTEARQAAERAAAGSEVGRSAEAALRAMPAVVLDSTQVRGLRWEFFAAVSVFSPCTSIKTLTFGPGKDYAEWMAAARSSLVRRPSDEALLELMLRGPFGTGGCLPLLGGLRMVQAVQ